MIIDMRQEQTWRVWWTLLRPHTLTAGFIPVLIGSALALDEGHFDFLIFAAMMLASLLIQAATNMFNEYYDYKKGLDDEHSVGIGGTIVRHGVKPAVIMQIALSFYLIAILIGAYICAQSSWWLVLIGLGSMAVGFLYTGGPFPIAYSPFGEIFSGFFMGYVIISISYFIQTKQIITENWIITLPASLLIANILSANNIRDLENDKTSGRKTLAILLGKKYAILALAMVFSVSYLVLLIMPFRGITPFWTWLSFLSIPKSVSAVKGFIGKKEPKEMMPAMVATAKTNTIFGLLFAIGLFIGYFI